MKKDREKQEEKQEGKAEMEEESGWRSRREKQVGVAGGRERWEKQ